jgi:hypothetical protein
MSIVSVDVVSLAIFEFYVYMCIGRPNDME